MANKDKLVIISTNEESEADRKQYVGPDVLLGVAKDESLGEFLHIHPSDRPTIQMSEDDPRFKRKMRIWAKKMRRYRVYNYETRKFEV